MYVYPTSTWGVGYGPTLNWRVYSSVNLADWTDHGIIFSNKEYVNGSGPYCTAPWTTSGMLWAPTACYKNGEYYFYYYINNCYDFIKKPANVSPFWAQCNGVAKSSNGGGPYTNITEKGPSHSRSIGFMTLTFLLTLLMVRSIYMPATDPTGGM